MRLSEEEQATASEVFMLPAGHTMGEGYEKSEEQIEFEKFRDEMKESNEYAKLNIYRQPMTGDGRPGAKKLTFLFECGVDEFSFSQLAANLRDNYGTGTYRIQARDAGGALKLNRAIQVEAPKDLTVSPDANPMGGMMREFSEAMHQQSIMMRELMGPQNIGDPMDQMVKMMSAMGAMMGAMGIQNTPPLPPKTMIESLTEMKLMRELLGDLTGGNNESGEGNIMGLLTATVQNLGPLLGAAISAGQKDGTVNTAGIVQPTALEHNPKPATAGNEMSIEQAAQIEAIKPQLEFLIKQAEGGAEPHDVADFVIRLVPDDKLEELETFLSTETCADVCVLAVPEIKVHMEWFEKWLAAMLSNLAIILDVEETDVPGKAISGKELTGDKDESITEPSGDESLVAGSDNGPDEIAPTPDTEQSGDTPSAT